MNEAVSRSRYWAALVLIVSGFVLLLPVLYEGLAELAGGYYPHMILGAACFVSAWVLLRKT